MRRAQYQRGQRQQAALAAIVGAHDDDDVFDGHDQDQRPEDQRQRAENRVLADPAIGEQRLLGGIERRGADIAEHDAERRQRQAAGAARSFGRIAIGKRIRHRSRIPAGGALVPSSRPRGPGRTRCKPPPSARHHGPFHPKALRCRLLPGAVAAYRANQSAARTIHRPIRRDNMPSPQATADCCRSAVSGNDLSVNGVFFILLADAAAFCRKRCSPDTRDIRRRQFAEFADNRV